MPSPIAVALALAVSPGCRPADPPATTPPAGPTDTDGDPTDVVTDAPDTDSDTPSDTGSTGHTGDTGATTTPPTPTRAPTTIDLPNAYGFGMGVSGGGGLVNADINGDGYDDLAVGAFNAGASLCGQAFVYLGGAGGIDTYPASTLDVDRHQLRACDYFGWAVAIVGDTDGDGYADLVVGAPYGGTGDDGSASVYPGGPYGVDAVPVVTLSGTGNGDPVSGLGDVDGDGYADIAAGARVYLGSAAGLADPPAFTFPPGSEVRPAGDVNGDGYADVVVGAPDLATASVHLGPDLALAVTWSGPADSRFGASVAAGDVDGDGYGDVWIGAPYAANGAMAYAGTLSLFLGGPALPDAPALVRAGQAPSEELGSDFASIGDHNGDGYADVIEARRQGAADVLLGSAAPSAGSAPGIPAPPQMYAAADPSVSGGDFDGDGIDDRVIAWPYLAHLVVTYGGPDGDLDGIPDAEDPTP